MMVLSEQQLMKNAPSIFATAPSTTTTDRYSLIPTIECVRGLKKAGFEAVFAKESNCRSIEKKPFVKHILRFRHHNNLALNGKVPEIVLVNSHDGLSSYQLRAGIYRIVCSNGLIVGNEWACHKIRHSGDIITKVVDSAHEIIEVIPQIMGKADEWEGITLEQPQRLALAEVAGNIKWGVEQCPISAERLLLPKRRSDNSMDLWTTYNVLQENLIRGGQRYYNAENGRYNSTRAVNSVNENTRLNTALWALTEKMAQLAAV